MDIAVTNYAYSDSTIACVLTFTQGPNVGTQLLFSKKGAAGMHLMVFTD